MKETEVSLWTTEPHGNAIALYSGRTAQHHGYRLMNLAEAGDHNIEVLTTCRNVVAELAHNQAMDILVFARQLPARLAACQKLGEHVAAATEREQRLTSALRRIADQLGNHPFVGNELTDEIRNLLASTEAEGVQQ